MASSIKIISGNTSNSISQARLLSNTQSVEARSNSLESIKSTYAAFSSGGIYETKRGKLLNQLNAVLSLVKSGANYSLGENKNLPIDTIFNEYKLNNINCNEGKKAYAYYLKEVLQKLNQLNQYISKGQEALKALNNCTTEDQIKNYKTTLEIQSDLVKNCLNELTKYTVIQTFNTTRTTKRNNLNETLITARNEQTSEINYEIRYKDISTSFTSAVPNTLEGLRNLKTQKEFGTQTITTTLSNKETGNVTNLNDKWGFNVVTRSVFIEKKETSLIASFDELTLLDKLKYIIVYYKNNSNPYYYPNDTKTGIPCMSREELKKYVPDEDGVDSNKNKLQSLGIIPSDANAPKTDDVEVGAVELFYVGYLGNSQGAINALAKFMEIKSVALLTQITQQSYRIKALKLYLKMLEIGLQELNKSYNTSKGGDGISEKTYLALKYAAANQTRTLITINNEDYIVMQLDRDTTTDNYHLSNNNAYILVKATTDGINEFLELGYTNVDNFLNTTSKLTFKQDKTKIEIEMKTEKETEIKIELYDKVKFNNLSTLKGSNLLFMQTNDTNAIVFLPKELETVKTKMDKLTNSTGGLSWNNTNPDKNTNFDQNWPSIVEMWQNTCQTAIDNIGSQIESVNKTIKSLRSKVDTFDSSSSRFRDKFYSTIMTVLNKIS